MELQKWFILNTSKMKEMIVDSEVCGLDIEVVTKYKYRGFHLNNKLDWSLYTDKLLQEVAKSPLFVKKTKNMLRSAVKCYRCSISLPWQVCFSMMQCAGGALETRMQADW